MSFWTGFFAGIVATYALALTVMVFLFWRRKSDSAEAPPLPCENEQLDFSAEYPTVSFTHFTNIGTAVRGADD